MPTAWPRVQVTLTPPVQAALDRARALQPDKSASALLAELAVAGAAARVGPAPSRHEVVREYQGVFAGMYPDGYLEELRRDWDGRP